MNLTLREMHVTLDGVVTDCIADLIILEARANKIQNDFHLKKGGDSVAGVTPCDVVLGVASFPGSACLPRKCR